MVIAICYIEIKDLYIIYYILVFTINNKIANLNNINF